MGATVSGKRRNRGDGSGALYELGRLLRSPRRLRKAFEVLRTLRDPAEWQVLQRLIASWPKRPRDSIGDVCAFVRGDKICKKPPRGWKTQYEKLLTEKSISFDPDSEGNAGAGK